MPILQEAREVELFSPLGYDVLLFQRMTATEQLGQPFEYELNLLSKDSNIKLQDLLGKTMSIRLTLPGNEERHFSGYVSRFSQMGVSNGYYTYQASLRPWLWLLSRTANCRIFQQKTVPDIVKQVFRDYGFSDFEESLSGAYRMWEYCVQYRETDFNFVSRLMEQEGIYYYFKNTKDIHTLVLSDSISSHDPIPGFEKIAFQANTDQSSPEEGQIFEWFTTQEVQPGTYAMNDYNFKIPRANLEVKLSQQYEHEQSDYEVFDYPGEYSEASEGDSYVRVRLEEFTSQHELAQGQTNARGITVGGLFTLTDFPRSDQNKEHLVVSTQYDITSNQYESGAETDEDVFSASFTAMDSKIVYRSLRRTPKPTVQGPQTATVVGKAGEEIWTDEFGRVKVQFHWDREGNSDENSSCWIRVSHPTAGKSWGAVSIPRIGQEVIVDFLEGDPDRPIITGRVYNGDNAHPYELPANQTQSGYKSRSSIGGNQNNFNEIRFEDKKDEEQVYIHAEKDQDNFVENNETTQVGNNRTETIGNDETITIGNNRTESVGNDEVISIASNRTENVGKNEMVTIAINKAETIGVAKALSIGAAYQVTVGAAMNETIGGAKAEEIGAAKAVLVGGNSSENVGNNKSIKSGKKMDFLSGDNLSIVGKKKGLIELADELIIKVGKAKIVMKKNGDISIEGKKIQIKGSSNVIIKGKKILEN